MAGGILTDEDLALGDQILAGPSAPPAQPQSFDTPLSPAEEAEFQKWKATYAPNDTGEDYDLRGAYKAGLKPNPKTGHWPDTFKKPNHPTFSNQSKYAAAAPEKAGRWEGDKYIPPESKPAKLTDDDLATGDAILAANSGRAAPVTSGDVAPSGTEPVIRYGISSQPERPTTRVDDINKRFNSTFLQQIALLRDDPAKLTEWLGKQGWKLEPPDSRGLIFRDPKGRLFNVDDAAPGFTAAVRAGQFAMQVGPEVAIGMLTENPFIGAAFGVPMAAISAPAALQATDELRQFYDVPTIETPESLESASYQGAASSLVPRGLGAGFRGILGVPRLKSTLTNTLNERATEAADRALLAVEGERDLLRAQIPEKEIDADIQRENIAQPIENRLARERRAMFPERSEAEIRAALPPPSRGISGAAGEAIDTAASRARSEASSAYDAVLEPFRQEPAADANGAPVDLSDAAQVIRSRLERFNLRPASGEAQRLVGELENFGKVEQDPRIVEWVKNNAPEYAGQLDDPRIGPTIRAAAMRALGISETGPPTIEQLLGLRSQFRALRRSSEGGPDRLIASIGLDRIERALTDEVAIPPEVRRNLQAADIFYRDRMALFPRSLTRRVKNLRSLSEAGRLAFGDVATDADIRRGSEIIRLLRQTPETSSLVPDLAAAYLSRLYEQAGQDPKKLRMLLGRASRSGLLRDLFPPGAAASIDPWLTFGPRADAFLEDVQRPRAFAAWSEGFRRYWRSKGPRVLERLRSDMERLPTPEEMAELHEMIEKDPEAAFTRARAYLDRVSPGKARRLDLLQTPEQAAAASLGKRGSLAQYLYNYFLFHGAVGALGGYGIWHTKPALAIGAMAGILAGEGVRGIFARYPRAAQFMVRAVKSRNYRLAGNLMARAMEGVMIQQTTPNRSQPPYPGEGNQAVGP